MCIRDSSIPLKSVSEALYLRNSILDDLEKAVTTLHLEEQAVSYTHLRAHETVLDLVCRLLLEKKKQKQHQAVTHSKNYINKDHI